MAGKIPSSMILPLVLQRWHATARVITLADR
jgi:hypothetical protein